MLNLSFDIKTILDVDAIIVTHTHDNHWNRGATERIYAQNDSDAELLSS